MARLNRRALLTAAAGLLMPAARTNAFYLPGGAPKSFEDGQKVEVQVVLLTSVKTQIPFDYYHIPFCESTGKVTKAAENLGEILLGDKIASSMYEFNMKESVNCAVLCQRPLSEGDVQQFSDLIDNSYKVHMQVDNFPVALREETVVNDEPRTLYTHGFPVGYEENGEQFLHNHLRFLVKYHEAAHFKGSRVVGFEVTPYSVKHRRKAGYTVSREDRSEKADNEQEMDVADASDARGEDKRQRARVLLEMGEDVLDTCQDIGKESLPKQTLDAASDVIFTYDVNWQLDSETTWSSRWDIFLKNTQKDIHAFAIINSLMITLFLTVVVAMILLRTLRKDITHYNELKSPEDEQESGWKLVHGDVFRPPSFSPMLLSVMCGTGMQVLAMTLTTITFAFLGFLSPANSGGMLTALLVLFVLMGSFAGYWSGSVYKFFNGKKWVRNMLATAFLFPSMIFVIFWSLDLTAWSQGASTAVPVSTFASLLFLWFFVSVPLVFIGSYFGFRAETYTIPVRVNQIARHVPEQMWYTHPAFAIALGGILPFGAVCIELFFIMNSLWLYQIYYTFGFLYVVFFILIVTCAEITMVTCYFQLCNEDHRWWWRAFLSAGSSAGYLFVYSIWFFYSKLEITRFVSTTLYFGYMLVIALTFFLLTGSTGFFACFWFVRKIYSAIKVD